MSQLEKLKARIRARPPTARFDEVRRLLEECGWEMKRQRGSHVVFKKAGMRSITVPIDGGQKVKQRYLEQICDLLGLDD